MDRIYKQKPFEWLLVNNVEKYYRTLGLLISWSEVIHSELSNNKVKEWKKVKEEQIQISQRSLLLFNWSVKTWMEATKYCTIIVEVKYHHLCYILLVTQTNPGTIWEQTTQKYEYQEIRIVRGPMDADYHSHREAPVCTCSTYGCIKVEIWACAFSWISIYFLSNVRVAYTFKHSFEVRHTKITHF